MPDPATEFQTLSPPTARSARTGRRPIEDFFAHVVPDPLAAAFPDPRRAHPPMRAQAVPEADVPLHWERLLAQPRRQRGCGYVHVPFC